MNGLLNSFYLEKLTFFNMTVTDREAEGRIMQMLITFIRF